MPGPFAGVGSGAMLQAVAVHRAIRCCGSSSSSSISRIGGYTRLLRLGSASTYATGAKEQEKTKERATPTKYMGLRPLSPAVDSMAEAIGAGVTPVDVKSEIEALRFTEADLFDDLPKHYSQESGSAASMATGDDLAAVSKDRALDTVRELRKKRAHEIQSMFRQDQLQAYLQMNGQRTTGTKSVLTERIVNRVWGITRQSLEARAVANEQKADDDGMTMRLNDEALAQLESVESGALESLGKEFGVSIALRLEDKSLRVAGRMPSVRAALSAVREKLAASATVEVDLSRYGTPRALEPNHVGRICNAIHRAFGGDGTVTYFDGELFARGRTRADTLDIQQALVDALVEPAHDTLFVVVPTAVADAETTTVVPAVDIVSRPRTFIPSYQLFADAAAVPDPREDVLAAHALFCRRPAGRIEPCEDTSIVDALRKWATGSTGAADTPTALSFRLGRVMFDMDRDADGLYDQFRCPCELLEAIDHRGPLFAFSSSVSPLKWLHSQGTQGGSGADHPTEQHLVLTFGQMPPQPDTAGDTPVSYSASNMLPVYGGERLVARISVVSGKAQYDAAQVERVSNEQRANVAIVQSAYDLQATASCRQPMDATDRLADALRGAVRQLSIAADPNREATQRRHGLIDTPAGQYALIAAELDSTTRKQLGDGLAVCVHQVWDVIDHLWYSQVELAPQLAVGGAQGHSALPQDAAEWERLVQRLLAAAAAEGAASSDIARQRHAT